VAPSIIEDLPKVLQDFIQTFGRFLNPIHLNVGREFYSRPPPVTLGGSYAPDLHR